MTGEANSRWNHCEKNKTFSRAIKLRLVVCIALLNCFGPPFVSGVSYRPRAPTAVITVVPSSMCCQGCGNCSEPLPLIQFNGQVEECVSGWFNGSILPPMDI
jgi:hypothetical protein